jgi:hypothetical protein
MTAIARPATLVRHRRATPISADEWERSHRLKTLEDATTLRRRILAAARAPSAIVPAPCRALDLRHRRRADRRRIAGTIA